MTKKAATRTAMRIMAAAATIPPIAPFDRPPLPPLLSLVEPALAVASVFDTVEGKNLATAPPSEAVEIVVGVEVVIDVVVIVRAVPSSVVVYVTVVVAGDNE